MTLLEKALASDVRKPKERLSADSIKEKVEVALAMARGQISGPQFAAALGISNKVVNVYCREYLYRGVRDGILTVSMNGTHDGK